MALCRGTLEKQQRAVAFVLYIYKMKFSYKDFTGVNDTNPE